MLLTDVGCVVGSTENELWSPIVSGADVAHIGFSCNEDLRRPKVTKFEHTRGRVEQ